MLVYDWSQDASLVPMFATLTLQAPDVVGTCAAPLTCPVALHFSTPWGNLDSWYPGTELTFDLRAQPDDLLAGSVRLNWEGMQLSFAGTGTAWQMTLNEYVANGFFYDPAATSATAAEPSTALLLALAFAAAAIFRKGATPARCPR